MGLVVKQENSGERLDRFLQKELTALSRAQIQKMIKAGEVLVDDKMAAVHYFLKEGNKIEIRKQKTETSGGEKTSDSQGKLVKIIAEEKDYVVVDKPAGMVAHHDNLHKDNTLIDWLVKKYPEIKKVGEDEGRPGIVHRLDKDVSGLMVVARNQKMFECLKKQFQDRKTEKEYLALAYGVVNKDEGVIKRAIGRARGELAMKARSKTNRNDREAQTGYQVVERFKNFTLLKIKILTGRTHQIRVHLKALGHSLVGDRLYVTRDIKKKKQQMDLGRVWLFAERLGFKDLEGKWQEYKVKMPKELEEFLGACK